MTIIDNAPPIMVCESLIQEHRHMEMMLEKLEDTMKSSINSSTDSLIGLFKAISLEIDIHFACEERGLFPILSNYHPMFLMEVEHEEIVAIRNEMNQDLENYSEQPEVLIQKWKQLIPKISELLLLHIAREDKGIFPLAERDLKFNEKNEVIRIMTELREINKTHPVLALERNPKVFKSFSTFSVTNDKPVSIFKLFEADDISIRQLNVLHGESTPPHWSPKRTIIICFFGEAWLEIQPEGNELLTAEHGTILDPKLTYVLHATKDSCFLIINQATNQSILNDQTPS